MAQDALFFAVGDTCYVKYRITEVRDGKPHRVHKAIRQARRKSLTKGKAEERLDKFPVRLAPCLWYALAVSVRRSRESCMDFADSTRLGVFP